MEYRNYQLFKIKKNSNKIKDFISKKWRRSISKIANRQKLVKNKDKRKNKEREDGDTPESLMKTPSKAM